jgi:citrate lyase beta subunit
LKTSFTPISPIRSILLLKPSAAMYDTFHKHRADWYLLDMEDGVSPDRKKDVRELHAGQIRKRKFADYNLAVRLNGLNNRKELEYDLIHLTHQDVNLFILPMIDTPDDVITYERMIGRAEIASGLPAGHFRLAPVLETPRGLLNALRVAEASPRNLALIFGHNDLLTSIQGEDTEASLLLARQIVVLAARSAGLEPIDTPYHKLDRPNGFILECERSKALGFSGKILLHPNQADMANRLLDPKPEEIAWAEEILALHRQNKHIYTKKWSGRTFFGPPHVERAKSILMRGKNFPEQSDRDMVRGVMPEGGVDASDISAGKIVHSPFELTIRDGFITQWDGAFFNANRLSTSSRTARRMGFADSIAPYCLPLLLCGSMSICRFSESAEFHLGFQNAIYLNPLYPDDTVKNYFRIEQSRPTSGGEYSVVESTHFLTNQNDEPVFRFTKLTLFPRVFAKTSFREESSGGSVAPSPAESHLRARILAQPPELLIRPHIPRPALQKGQLIIHRLVKVFEASEVRSLSTLLRLTNVQHYDSERFRHEDLIVAGPLATTASLTLPLHDLGDILHEEILHCSNINIVNFNDTLGAVSFILDVQTIENNPCLEEITVKTLGIKNVNVQTLSSYPLPLELFAAGFMKPAEFETICRSRSPRLEHRIACQTVWKALRVRDDNQNR